VGGHVPEEFGMAFVIKPTVGANPIAKIDLKLENDTEIQIDRIIS
jgi:hypothetical protein